MVPFTDIFWIDATSESSVTSTFISISGLISTATDQLLDNDARIAFRLPEVCQLAN
jgi:hypothetical protein